eukprot:3558140-Rhodomonas_salina.2
MKLLQSRKPSQQVAQSTALFREYSKLYMQALQSHHSSHLTVSHELSKKLMPAILSVCRFEQPRWSLVKTF